MAKQAEDRWTKAEADLPDDSRPALRQLRTDYLTAARRHVPNWTGGPNAEILAELIRLGWRKAT